MTGAATNGGGPRDFTVARRPYPFKIDDDVFTAPAKLSVPTLRKLSSMRADLSSLDTGADIDATLDMVGQMFRQFLPGAGGERFVERLNADGADPATPPIDLIGEALPLIFALLEHYGMRPTQPSSVSSAGSTDETMAILSGGTSSTDGPLLTESII